ncbi:hypothetical protein KKA17_03780 [bacterium]|nr:hypothetical protein [bacterium]MBU1883959.1 hypothetical protein [bacterium]
MKKIIILAVFISSLFGMDNSKVGFSELAKHYISIAKEADKVAIGNQRIGHTIYGPYELEHNATLRKEFETAKAKEGDFCKEFFNDLLALKNIEVIPPVVRNVDYNNTTLTKEMGACHKMGMDIEFLNTIPAQTEPHYPTKFSLWKTHILNPKKENLLFMQSYAAKTNYYPMIYVLDKGLCKQAISKQNFNFKYDKQLVYEAQVIGSFNNWEFQLIRYKGNEYFIEIADHGNAGNYKYRHIRIWLYGDNTEWRVEKPECAKDFYKYIGEK